MRKAVLALLLCWLGSQMPGTALGAALPRDELERSCWLRHTAERTRVNMREPTLVDFSNLTDGVRVRSPFLVEFAVRGMGVVPAGTPMQGTGHHHILIDQRLPLDINQKIPLTDHHRHFGKGQTSAVLSLPPGPHTLRLLFADHDHKPYFVFSPEITIQVVGATEPTKVDPRNFEPSCEAWYREELTRPRPPGEWLSISNLRDGEAVSSPFNVRFGVDGFGVCAAGPAVDKTGHFLLEVLAGGRLVRTNDFANGATQGNLTLPNGSYTLRLRFVDSAGRRDLLPASESTIVVTGQERI